MSRARLAFAVSASVLLLSAELRAQSDEFGKWISLFNGKDTTGWIHAKSADPIAWKVEDGALTNGKDGAQDACTVDEFGDYELELDYKVPPKGNSGVYLRGQVEVQVFDSHGKTKGEPTDAGAIYGGHVPLRMASKPAGEWNQYRILHIGHHITVWHNGVLIQDNTFVDKATGGAMQKHPKTDKAMDIRRGPLMLQGDHGKVWFRNIRIRPLFTEGWKPLWNGKDLSGFTARGSRSAKDGLRWEVDAKEHALTNLGKGGERHDLWTADSYGNFLVHYAYKSDPKIEGGNSGFYLRDQWEIQILGHTDLKDKHSDGCIYSIYTPLVNARHAPEEWNHMDIKVEGMKIWVWQNGKLLHDGKVPETRTDNHGTPTKMFSKAPFKLQGDHGKVWFADLWIKPLPDAVASK